jgi:glycosyltransferase involved in cell wall biosynthesis
VKIHTVFITYNRLELTRVAISSYLETVSVPHTFCVVDNNSSDDTKRWLLNTGFDVHLLNENRYPGFACNLGWEHAPAYADFLHRADNDFSFLPGWCEEVERLFSDEKVGQIGLRTDEEELHAPWNVGGNCVIRRSLWDAGLRYDERPWPEFPPGYSEDSFFSPAIEALGYTWERVEHPCITSMASGDLGDPYYVKSYSDRGII